MEVKGRSGIDSDPQGFLCVAMEGCGCFMWVEDVVCHVVWLMRIMWYIMVYCVGWE